MKKYTHDMSSEELKQVFDANDKLRFELLDDAMQNTLYFISDDILPCWDRHSIDYCVGYDRGAYFRWREARGFLTGLHKANRYYGLLPDECGASITHGFELLDRYDDFSDDDPEIDAVIDRLCDDLAAAVHRAFKSWFESWFESCFDDAYLLSCLEEDCNGKYDACYIDTDRGDFVLLRDVAYTESYA